MTMRGEMVAWLESEVASRLQRTRQGLARSEDRRAVSFVTSDFSTDPY